MQSSKRPVRRGVWSVIRCVSAAPGRPARGERRRRLPAIQSGLRHAHPRAHPVQRAVGAGRPPCVTGPPSVAEQIQMELQLLARRRDFEHRVVELLERAPGRNSARRVPTRETWVSTGTSRIPRANSSTHAAVLRPTPGSEVRYACASDTGWLASQSSERVLPRTSRADCGASIGVARDPAPSP